LTGEDSKKPRELGEGGLEKFAQILSHTYTSTRKGGGRQEKNDTVRGNSRRGRRLFQKKAKRKAIIRFHRGGTEFKGERDLG